MKQVKLLFVFLLLAAGSMGSAWAGGHGHTHVGVGVYVGPGWGWYYPPYAHYPPYPYYQPYVGYPVVQSGPVTYVEQGAAVAPAPSSTQGQPPMQANTWYYCHEPDGYYPYVKQCPGGWQGVPAQPPAQQ